MLSLEVNAKLNAENDEWQVSGTMDDRKKEDGYNIKWEPLSCLASTKAHLSIDRIARRRRKPSSKHNKCWVPGCRNRKSRNPELSFFSFPSDFERCKSWLRRVGDEELVYIRHAELMKLRYVCESHFDPSFVRRGKSRVGLLKNAEPTIFDDSVIPLDDKLIEEFERLHDGIKQTQDVAQPDCQTEKEYMFNTLEGTGTLSFHQDSSTNELNNALLVFTKTPETFDSVGNSSGGLQLDSQLDDESLSFVHIEDGSSVIDFNSMGLEDDGNVLLVNPDLNAQLTTREQETEHDTKVWGLVLQKGSSFCAVPLTSPLSVVSHRLGRK